VISSASRRHGTTPARKPDPETKRVRSGEDFDIIIGLLGFWAVALLVVTVVMELTGQPALGWAMGLLAVVLALWGMLRLRKKLPRRTSRRLG
jgi:Flp pilus assembly protein TadB